MSGPLFKPFRALGYITDNVPFAVQRRGKETFVTVSVGRTWQVYNTAKLTLVTVGPQLSHDVTALACKGDLTFAATGSSIEESKRMHRSACYAGHSAAVIQLMVLGDYLLSLGKDSKLLVWKIGEYDEPQVSINFEPGFTPTCMCHPETYINKVVVGSAEGQMQLWNFVTANQLYVFPGWGSPIKCISSSPALDVVGVGLADGRAVLHNLKFDETVVSFTNAAGAGTADALYLTGTAATASSSAGGGACTCVSFRTGAGLPLMAAGGGAGVVTVWNLEDKRLHTVLRDAHDAPLLTLHFFAGEPLLMSSAADNSIKQWVFDGQDAQPRLLKFRSGHSAPPSVVQHYAEGLRLLSAGQDRAFRVFSTIQDQQSRELSQHHTARRAKRLKVKEEELKLPRITALAACEVRERDWCNVITSHEGDPSAYTWRLQHFTLGTAALRPPANSSLPGIPDAPVTAVSVSPCGNFGLVGTAAGCVDRYNMQSGLHRGSYVRKADDSTGPLPAHDGTVVGVAVDSCNKLMVTAGSDAMLRIWDFKRQTLTAEISVGSPVTHMSLHSSSALLAVAGSDLVIRMYDIEAARLVRRFKGHRDRVTCLCVSSDCRWLLSSAMDGSIRVWDIPAAKCLQVMQMGSPVTCLSLSPAMDMLATTHVHKRGVFLWSNQMLFGDPSAVSVYTDTPVPVALPSIASSQQQKGAGHDGQLVNGGADVQLSQDGPGAESEESSSDFFLESDDSDADEDAGTGGNQQAAWDLQDASASGMDVDADDAAQSDAQHMYEQKDASGAPIPLTPSLATLSLLPRSQWETLLHIDLIKARSKPIQPPKKPEAAPFFLPTVPTLSGQPAFNPAVLNVGVAPGETDSKGVAAMEDVVHTRGLGDAAGVVGPPGAMSGGSRVVRSQPGRGAALLTTFIRLLRAGADAGDYTSFVAHIRGLTPTALDRELRSMVLIEGATDDEVSDVEHLLDCIDTEVAANRNFEFCQALLSHILTVNADALIAYDRLAVAAARVRRRLRTSWKRLDDLLQNVRCMVDYLSNTQA